MLQVAYLLIINFMLFLLFWLRLSLFIDVTFLYSSAAVLDRLNACLENNGELNLQECGDATCILKAHNDFRLSFVDFTFMIHFWND